MQGPNDTRSKAFPGRDHISIMTANSQSVATNRSDTGRQRRRSGSVPRPTPLWNSALRTLHLADQSPCTSPTKVQGKPCIGLPHVRYWIALISLLIRKVTVMDTHQHASPATRLIGAALTAGALLLAAPVATAIAAPPTGPGPGTPGAPGRSGSPGGGPSAPGDTTGASKPSSSGVNSRPKLAHPAPVVQAVQKAGDQVFTPGNAALNDSPLGVAYHQLFGAAGAPQDANGVIDPGEAYQGQMVGILNHPNLPGPGKLYGTPTGAGSAQPGASRGSNHVCSADVQVCIRH